MIGSKIQNRRPVGEMMDHLAVDEATRCLVETRDDKDAFIILTCSPAFMGLWMISDAACYITTSKLAGYPLGQARRVVKLLFCWKAAWTAAQYCRLRPRSCQSARNAYQ